MEKIVKSNCRGCHGGCGVLVHVEDGRVTKIEGNPNFPTNNGAMCSRGLAFLQLVYHPDRVIHPLQRVGKRGEGKWRQISWDEALDTIAAKYKEIIKEYGAESIVLGYGTGRNYEGFLYRFANLLGTPNVLTAGHMCYGPRVATSGIINGKLTLCDYENHPRCVVVWGNNVVISNGDEYTGENLTKALSRGTKLIVVDPRLTFLAGRADVWLQLRPGTDAALALGMANVIIEEELYDKEFVKKHVHGWDEFVKRAKEYDVNKVAEITWVPAEKIKEAARLYARTKPAGIQWGCAIEQNINCTDTIRALVALMALTGNLDVPGGNISPESPPWLPVSKFAMHHDLPPEQRAKRLGGNIFKLADKIAVITPKVVWDAILTGKPYPVKAIQIHGSNPVITRSNAAEIYRALSQLEFLTVADFFLTPTAELADIVLPAATWLEMEDIGDYWKRQNYIYPRTKIIQVGDCKSDHEMFLELGKRLGQQDHWFDTVEGDLDFILKPMGLTWQEFRRLEYYRVSQKYRQYKKEGFRTPTGKIELYSTIMEKWGYDPVPGYRETPESPVSKPEMVKEYPFILITGARSPVFYTSEHRMIPWLREIVPDPVVEIHPDAAVKLGIKNSQWVYIETPRGRIKQRALLTTGINPGVVAAQYGWWYPEIKNPEHGWNVSNANILTDNDPKGYDVAMGADNLRVLMCKIYPVE